MSQKSNNYKVTEVNSKSPKEFVESGDFKALDYGFLKALMDDNTKSGEWIADTREIREYIENRLLDDLNLKEKDVNTDKINYRINNKFGEQNKGLITVEPADKINEPKKVRIKEGCVNFIQEVLEDYESNRPSFKSTKEELKEDNKELSEKVEKLDNKVKNQKIIIEHSIEFLSDRFSEFDPNKPFKK